MRALVYLTLLTKREQALLANKHFWWCVHVSTLGKLSM